MAATFDPILAEYVPPRFLLAARRYLPVPGTATVIEHRDGVLNVLRWPGDRLTMSQLVWTRIKRMYQVDISEHRLEWESRLPSSDSDRDFTATLLVGCTVADPVAIVERGIRDAAEVIGAPLIAALQKVTRRFHPGERGSAESAITDAQRQGALDEAIDRAFTLHTIHVHLTVEPPTAEQRHRRDLYLQPSGDDRWSDLARLLAQDPDLVKVVEAFRQQHPRSLEAELAALNFLFEHRDDVDAGELPRALLRDVIKRLGGAERAGSRSLESSVAVHVRAEMDPTVVVGRPSTMLVAISSKAIKRMTPTTTASTVASIKAHSPLVVELIPRVNLEVPEFVKIDLAPPTSDHPSLAQFDIVPREPGPVEVWIVVRQGQAQIARLVLRSAAVASISQVPRDPIRAEQDATVAATPPRAIPLLRIHEQRISGALIYRYDLEAPDLGLLAAAESRPITADRSSYLRSLFARIEGRWLSQARDLNAFQEDLRAFGAELLDELMPVEMQRTLWECRDQLSGVLALSTEPFIPWELVHLKDPVSHRLPDETRFLGQMGLVRWLWGTWPSKSLPVRRGRIRYVIPAYSDARYALPEPDAEREYLERSFGATPITPRHREVLDALRSADGFDLLHFAGHGRTSPDDIADAQLLLEGREEGMTYIEEPLRASLVAQNFSAADGPGPVVVLNACQTGRLGYRLSSIGGFAEAFVAGGAGAFIGSLWSIGDRPARRFIETLYEGLQVGGRMAEAAAEAREAARRDGDATWLGYTLYGHPDAVFDMQPGPEERLT
jgi:hypothetical protein